MEQAEITELGDELYEALSTGKTVSPLTSRGFDISIEDALSGSIGRSSEFT